MPKQATWYHAHVERVSRGDSKSFVGLVSYITGEKLKDEQTGRWCTRNHPGEVLGWGIAAQDTAPAFYTNTKKLSEIANQLQAAETRINSHLGNHENLALSDKFGEQDHLEVMAEIARRYTERYGVVTVWSVHKPTDHGDDRNWHGHLASNMRRVGADGIGEKAREIVDMHTRGDERKWQRQMYADVINERLTKLGIDEEVSPLSYAERGIDREPMKHRGDKQNQSHLKGLGSVVADFNEEVKQRNRQAEAENARHTETIQRLDAELIDLLAYKKRKETDGMASPDEIEADGQLSDQEARLKIAHEQKDRSDDYIRQQETIRADAERDRKKIDDERKAKEREGDITDAKSRYAQAAADFYDIRDPYRSLARVAMAEHAEFKKGQERLKEQIADENNPEKKKLLELRHDIQHADYMALTSEKLAGISYVITSKRGEGTQHERDTKAAQNWREQGKELRGERRDLQKDMGDRAMASFSKDVEQLERETGSKARRREDDGESRRARGKDLSDDQQQKLDRLAERNRDTERQNSPQMQQQRSRGGRSR